jgi:hypothetical protein
MQNLNFKEDMKGERDQLGRRGTSERKEGQEIMMGGGE